MLEVRAYVHGARKVHDCFAELARFINNFRRAENLSATERRRDEICITRKVDKKILPESR